MEELFSNDLSYLLGEDAVKELREQLASKDPSVSQDVSINKTNFLMLAHFSGPNLILDFEPYEEVDIPFFFQKQLSLILNKFQAAKSINQLCKAATVLGKKMFDTTGL